MGLLALLGLMLLVCGLLVEAPVLRLGRELPGTQRLGASTLQLLPTLLASGAIAVFGESAADEASRRMPPQPLTDYTIMAAMLVQFAFAWLALANTSVTRLAKAGYGVLAALGSVAGIVAIGFMLS